MFLLLLYYKSLSFQEELGVHVLILRVKELSQAAFFTDDEVGSLLSTLVSAVEVAPGLLVEQELKNLREPLQELGLASVWRTMNQHAVGLVLLVQYQVLDYVLDELVMFSGLEDLDNIIQSSLSRFNILYILIKICSNIRQLLLGLEVIIQIFSHSLEVVSLHDGF